MPSQPVTQKHLLSEICSASFQPFPSQTLNAETVHTLGAIMLHAFSNTS